MPKSEIDRAAGKALVRPNELVTRMAPVINVEAWAQSLAYGTAYDEPDPDFIARNLAIMTMTAESADDILDQGGVKGLQKLVPDRESETWGPFELTNLYVAKSDFATGNPSFVIMTVTHLVEGAEYKISTGATNIQASLIGLLSLGVWPIRAKFKRGISKDRGERYLLHLVGPD